MIVWCASYPKSGNTWVRGIIASLIYSKDGIFNFDMLKKVSLFPKRLYFKEFTDDYSNLKKISKYWIDVQKKINSDGKLRIFKTHNGNYNFLGNDFTNKENTTGIIYVVRDPRNIITSIANHYQLNLKESTNFLLDEKKFLFNLNDNNDLSEENIITLLGSWKTHYNSWKIASNSLIIRYEDLLFNTKSEIVRLLNFIKKFINFDCSEKKILNIIKSTSFEKLKKTEEIEGFEEASNSSIKFFNLGPNNNWKNVLNKNLINNIEKNFNKEMKELRYI
ncbi:MAG TPA: sulfotransferase domain-containing protein [Candidatus Pelagibacter bacterium]|jgi:hypothetical protein|nr:sulfotransferase [Pelagibacteraceae bacterium]HJN84314.1 sulfotransferase domain-containing protein [Candidatus Pelagibacter bacterium]|tara:strand:+ start:1344 stop:2174 length:831 start_codon:yes stop_codon:yes gene_type:complete